MTDKYVMLDFDDPRSGAIAEVIGNKTSKKILSLLAERDMNASDISGKLKLPLNTIGYNLDKLVKAGLIEEAKGNYWSVKGKKIKSYKLSNKKIIISPKRMISGIIPTILSVGAIAFLIKFWTNSQEKIVQTASYAKSSGASEVMTGIANDMAVNAPQIMSNQNSNVWLWFILGAFVALAIYLILNLRRKND